MTKLFTIKIIEVRDEIFSDETGAFLNTSSKGTKYIMVMYDNETNKFWY